MRLGKPVLLKWREGQHTVRLTSFFVKDTIINQLKKYVHNSNVQYVFATAPTNKASHQLAPSTTQHFSFTRPALMQDLLVGFVGTLSSLFN
jgi:hypothetical protein